MMIVLAVTELRLKIPEPIVVLRHIQGKKVVFLLGS